MKTQVNLDRRLQAGYVVEYMVWQMEDVTGLRVMVSIEEEGIEIRIQHSFDTISSCQLTQVCHELCDVAHKFYGYLLDFDKDYALSFQEEVCALLITYDIECNRDEEGPCPKSMSWLRGDIRGFCFALANTLERWIHEIN